MTSALSVKDLKKTYPNGQVALAGVSLAVRRGEFFALLGPNGAGKSTLIGIVCSLINRTGGTVSVFGKDLSREPRAVKSCIGVVPQEFNFNLWENPLNTLVNQAGYYGIGRAEALVRAERYLRELGIWDKNQRPARELSGGMKRRLMIARALIHEPELLILDEPTAGVDIELRRSMWDFLRDINAAGTTIILTTHYLEEAESLCERIAIIDHGRIIEVADKKSLLNKLHQETFLLDLSRPLAGPWESSYVVRVVDETTLEVEVSRDQGINGLFAELSRQGIAVTSMRNKANRLEELFLRMVSDDEPEPGDDAVGVRVEAEREADGGGLMQ